MSTGYGKKHCHLCKPEKPCQHCLSVGYVQEFQLHRHNENYGRQTALKAVASISHENEMMEKDPAHANSYKHDIEIATDFLLAAGAYASNERHQKDEALKHIKPCGRGGQN